VHELSLEENKIIVWTHFIWLERTLTIEQLKRNLLYHYVLTLKAHWTELEDDIDNDAKFKHLNLLVKYIRAVYISTSSRLASLLKNREITYDLLWTLFKSNMKIYMIILDVEKSACYRYDFDKKRMTNTEITYFHVKCRLLDFNEQMFDEVLTALRIKKFQEIKRVDRLETFSFEFHEHQKEMKKYFVRCDRQFVSLMSQHHVQYHDNVFYIKKSEYVEVSVNSHIMIDVTYFCKINSNYTRLHINKLIRLSSLNNSYIFFFSDIEAEEVKISDFDITIMSEDDLMICSQMIYEWSFDNKWWRKSSFLKHSTRWSLC